MGQWPRRIGNVRIGICSAAACGALFGAALLVLTPLFVVTLRQVWSAEGLLLSRLQAPRYWLLDTAPFVLAVLFGYAWSRRLRRGAADVRARKLLAERLLTATQSLDAGVLIEDANRRILLVNPKLCSMFALPLPPEALVGLDCREASEQVKLLFESPDAFSSSTEALLSARTPASRERLLCRDGRVLERDYAPVFVGESYQGHIWSYRDVTAAEQLLATERDARQRVDLLMRIVKQGIVVADAKHDIIEWSPGAEELFDYSASEMIGQPLSRLIAESRLASFSAELAQVTTEPRRFSMGGRKRDGRGVELEVSLCAWETSSGKMTGAVLQDVTKHVLTERRAREVEKNWRDIAENSSDVLLLLDRVGTIVFANRGFHGVEVADLIGTNASALLSQSEEVLQQGLTQAFEHGLAFEHECRGQASGGASWLWSRIAPQSEDGEVVRAVLSISDVSERRSRDQASRRLAAIVETTNDAVISTDETGCITTWNRGAEQLFGWARSEIVGHNISRLCPPAELEAQCVAFGRLLAGVPCGAYDAVRQHKTGRTIHVSLSLSATRNGAGEFEGASAVIRDMSHHQELQSALQRAKEAAELANRLKSEFLANMSHEIRTPLNGVVGMADLLRVGSLSTEQQEYVTTLLEASQALRVIVDDVLDFSKIEAGQLRIDKVEFDLIALTTGAADMFRHAAEQSGTQIQLSLPGSAPLRLIGDPNRIRQVLINLINNAVKFTKHGRVDVRLSTRDANDAGVLIRAEVEDSGLGIERSAQLRLFQPFTQADGSITRRFGGTGLGLSISKRLVELMGGNISFSSQLGRGSSFVVELRLAQAQGSQSRRQAVPAALPKHDGGWRILVAEDNSINQRVVFAMLQGLGCKVDIARDGREAWELWKHGVYDLILMDCQMPEMSGFEVTRSIREVEGDMMHTPIIAMTAQAYAEDRQRCAEAGMDDHLAKPLTQSELRGTLAKWLQLLSSTLIEAAPPSSRRVCLDLPALERLELGLGEGGTELLGSLINAFLLEAPEVLKRLGSALEHESWEGLAVEAHRWRSSTGNLAAVELSELVRALEECALEHDASRAGRLIAALPGELSHVRAALTAYAGRKFHAAGPAVERAPTGATAWGLA